MSRLFVFFALILLLPARADENPLATLRRGHPRLMLTEERIESIRSTVSSDPLAKRWMELLNDEAKNLISTEPEVYSLENKKLLSESRSVLKRVSTLAALHRLTGNPEFAVRARKELSAAAQFPDWNPASFLSTAEMTLAFAIGYDWLHGVLPTDEKEMIRKSIIEKGLKPGLGVYQKGRGWPALAHNWNSVCNNGMIAGALAIADTDPEIASQILKAAKASVPKGYQDYAPDGGWPEGPGYWNYGTSYAVYGLACLESALGTDWGLAESPGFSRTGDFRIDLIGPTGKLFAFADSGTLPGGAPCLFWLANRFNRPDYDAAERKLSEDNPSIFHLIFFNPKFSPPSATELLAKRPISHVFRGTNVAILRSSREKPPPGSPSKADPTRQITRIWTSELSSSTAKASGSRRSLAPISTPSRIISAPCAGATTGFGRKDRTPWSSAVKTNQPRPRRKSSPSAIFPPRSI
jgi:hypothetical protein